MSSLETGGVGGICHSNISYTVHIYVSASKDTVPGGGGCLSYLSTSQLKVFPYSQQVYGQNTYAHTGRHTKART